MTKAISSESVFFKYLHTEHPFLKDINLGIDKGECVLICGESGSGKTSFSRLLNGISPNYIEGELTGHLETLSLKAGSAKVEEYVPVVGSVFQNPKTQHFTMDTTSELAFPMENMGIEPDYIRRLMKEKAKMFEIEHLLNRNIFHLSGGEKQQIAFVSANMLEPEVLILDEVTSNLDKEAIQRMSEMVRLLKKRGTTIVIMEHRLAWTKNIVDRYILFEKGKVVNQWTDSEFYQLSNQALHEMGLRSMNLKSHRDEIKSKRVEQIVSDKGILETKQLKIGYQNREVLSDLNLHFSSGEITGLMGSNGTGKSTLANTLSGLQEPLSGELLWNGKKVSAKTLIKKSFLVMQDMNYQLFSESVAEEVLLGAERAEYMDQVIDTLNLTAYKDRHPMSLSEGQKQRVAIASALLSGKEMIIFDEPTSGLDYKHMEQFGRLLNELKKTSTVIIVISHDEELASKWCDTIIELEKNI